MGQPIENAEMKIMSEDGRELAAGEWGEICIKDPIVMHGYWNKPEGTECSHPHGLAALRRHRRGG
jgi:long-chain acyl-CoA synthetase